MESVIRAAVVYFVLLVVFRLAGNRSIAQLTPFDFILFLIISESIQQAMITTDYSMTNAFLLVITLVGLDIMMSLWKQRSERVEKLLDGVPVLIMRDGNLLQDRMKRERIDEADILATAREAHGIERLDQLEHAVIETTGGISVIPKRR
jgi:uncharacterized membrane protein YcaP (DUF421 family)